MNHGGVRFIRYAYPPNELGYCGPDDHQALFEYGTGGVDDGGILALAQDFDGAWPYLELIGNSNGLEPLDESVVEAYWIGNGLLGRVEISDFGHSIQERFRMRAGVAWDDVISAVALGARPHHGFHVFCVYPWVGLMRSGSTAQPLRVLDQCRIRWGTVLGTQGDSASVESRPLILDGDQLTLGEPRVEVVVQKANGQVLSGGLVRGDRVAMHWGWVCERLTPNGLRILERNTRHVMSLANRVLAKPRTGVFA